MSRWRDSFEIVISILGVRPKDQNKEQSSSKRCLPLCMVQVEDQRPYLSLKRMLNGQTQHQKQEPFVQKSTRCLKWVSKAPIQWKSG